MLTASERAHQVHHDRGQLFCPGTYMTKFLLRCLSQCKVLLSGDPLSIILNIYNYKAHASQEAYLLQRINTQSATGQLTKSIMTRVQGPLVCSSNCITEVFLKCLS